ncbi:ferredoxin-type protein NapF [Halomonas sp. MCCC 1A11036]|uniref:Ferredoxin-type protein NapF n=1 Tax=Billgrantia zhangzhouensis TaxID=2733481 RepID=A0ABS9AL19_9GAMM|nr:ferredoxin-type protein NapF [Halomonas zhangzhouensis]MCE8022505.1 ferredoxin-type protein NapF [Halomonas zhangzhouensis]
MSAVDASRRALLKGRVRHEPVIRPPWAVPEPSFIHHCTRCGECLDVCETQILFRGDGGYPEVDFSRGECTLCRACVEACPEPAFSRNERSPPWDLSARIGDGCLGEQGVYCKSCGEVCEAGAIRFSFNTYRVPEPSVDSEACNGCGACVALCPVQAVEVRPAGATTS